MSYVFYLLCVYIVRTAYTGYSIGPQRTLQTQTHQYQQWWLPKINLTRNIKLMNAESHSRKYRHNNIIVSIININNFLYILEFTWKIIILKSIKDNTLTTKIKNTLWLMASWTAWLRSCSYTALLMYAVFDCFMYTNWCGLREKYYWTSCYHLDWSWSASSMPVCLYAHKVCKCTSWCECVCVCVCVSVWERESVSACVCVCVWWYNEAGTKS